MRSARLDNIKGLLIFLIVFGHLLELFDGKVANGVYIAIYSFHVPAFVFCSGVVARYNPRKILCGIAYPYVVFQLLYVWAMNTKFMMLKPNWLMWYMFALAVWKISLAIVKTRRNALILLPFSVLFSLLAGFSPSIGSFLSLSRIICFYPFFLMGYAFSSNNGWQKKLWVGIYKVKYIFLALFAISLALLAFFSPSISKTSMYFRNSYTVWTGVFFRLALLLVSCFAICCLFIFVRNRRCFLTIVGKNTMPVYLLHGFAVIWLRTLHLQFGRLNIAFCFVLAAILCFVLSRETVKKILSPFFLIKTKGYL